MGEKDFYGKVKAYASRISRLVEFCPISKGENGITGRGNSICKGRETRYVKFHVWYGGMCGPWLLSHYNCRMNSCNRDHMVHKD